MIWIIGAGGIAREYAKVLKALGKEFICIGRSEKTAKEFEEATGTTAVAGGLENFLATQPGQPKAAIVATNLGSLSANTISLIKYGVKRVFCEKPGFLFPNELEEVAELSKVKGAEVYYAYNRRFFAATLAAEKVIEEDGGLRSFNFEFTEWGHVISQYNKPHDELSNWFYVNSTHVIDLAFFLGGNPIEMSCYSKDAAEWHKPINFAGAGHTDKDVLFNYQANWDAPGRWAVEMLTSKHRIYLKPMEQLQLQDKGSVKVYPVVIDDHLDKEFKPGFYLETKAFLEGDTARLCSVQQQLEHVRVIYNKILGL